MQQILESKLQNHFYKYRHNVSNTFSSSVPTTCMLLGCFHGGGWLIGFNVLWWFFCLVWLGFKLCGGGGFVVVVCFFLSLFYPK